MDSTTVKPPQDTLTVRRLRLSVGVVAIALPFVLLIGNAVLVGRPTLLASISASYYTGMRDVFVGSMCAIGVFLICYRYARPDDILSTIAGALAIIVALFPTATDVPIGVFISGSDRWVGRVHQVAAAVLFLLLAVFCFALFTRTPPGPPVAPEKRRRRNGVYRTCGAIIVAAIVLAVASNALSDSVRDAINPLFWCETVAVIAFGAAWLVKGEATAKDARDAVVPDQRPDDVPTDPVPH